MNENFNRQFLLLDFEWIDDPRFLDFVTKAQFATFLILMRYIWRGREHRLGLHDLYWKERKLASAVGRQKIAAKLGLKDETRVSKHLSALQETGVIQSMRTGRESIFVLGEWIDISEKQDKSKRKEWFYIERVFGIPTSDVAENPTSDVTGKSEVPKTPHQRESSEPHQMWLGEPHSNIEENREFTVNVGNGNLKYLRNLDQPLEKTKYVANFILDQLGDRHSWKFYQLAAAKIPEKLIRLALSEIRVDGAREPAKVFTYRMKRYVQELATQG